MFLSLRPAPFFLLLFFFLFLNVGLPWGHELVATVLYQCEIVDGEIDANIFGLRAVLLEGRVGFCRCFFLRNLGQKDMEVVGRLDLDIVCAFCDDLLHLFKPVAGQDVLQGHSLLRVELQNAGDQVL